MRTSSKGAVFWMSAAITLISCGTANGLPQERVFKISVEQVRDHVAEAEMALTALKNSIASKEDVTGARASLKRFESATRFLDGFSNSPKDLIGVGVTEADFDGVYELLNSAKSAARKIGAAADLAYGLFLFRQGVLMEADLRPMVGDQSRIAVAYNSYSEAMPFLVAGNGAEFPEIQLPYITLALLRNLTRLEIQKKPRYSTADANISDQYYPVVLRLSVSAWHRFLFVAEIGSQYETAGTKARGDRESALRYYMAAVSLSRNLDFNVPTATMTLGQVLHGAVRMLLALDKEEQAKVRAGEAIALFSKASKQYLFQGKESVAEESKEKSYLAAYECLAEARSNSLEISGQEENVRKLAVQIQELIAEIKIDLGEDHLLVKTLRAAAGSGS